MKIDAQEWMRRRQMGEFVRVYFNGEDITLTDLVYADDEAGIVRRLVLDAEGRVRLDGDTLATQAEVGHVEFVVEKIAVPVRDDV
jgi:hypothetical protein